MWLAPKIDVRQQSLLRIAILLTSRDSQERAQPSSTVDTRRAADPQDICSDLVAVFDLQRTSQQSTVNMIGATLLAVLFVSIGVQAQGRGVTVVPVTDASTLPQWNSATKISGPWRIKVSDCTNSTASRGACSIEGYGASCDAKHASGEGGIEEGSVCINFIRKILGVRDLIIRIDHNCQQPTEHRDAITLQRRIKNL